MKYVVILLLWICRASTNAQPADVLHRPYAVKFHLLDSLRSRPGTDEQNVKILGDLEKWAQINGDDELYEELVLTELWTIGREHGDPLTEGRVLDIALNAREKKQKYVEADALEELGDLLSGRRKFGLEFENHLAAYSIYNKFSTEEFPRKAEYIYTLAGQYYHYDDHENAIKYMEEALKTSNGDVLLKKPIYNSIGLSYRKMQRYDSSEIYFRRIYDEAVAKNDSGWIGIAAGNIGINYFLQKRYDEAIPLLEKDISLSIATKTIKNAAHSLSILAQIYYDKKEGAKAEQLLLQAIAICERKSFWPDYLIAEPIYALLSKVYAAKGDIRKAYQYAELALIAKDSVASQNNAVGFAKAKEKTDLMQHKLDQELLANQRKVDELTRDSLIVAILLLTIIAILFINRQRLKQRKLEADKRNAESDLEMATVQLEGFRQSIQEKNRIIEHFSHEISQTKELEQAETETDVLTQLQHAIILTDEQWENFRILFEKVHKNFFVNLKKKMPDLTQAEIRFFALTKLKLTSKEMAGMLGISPNTVRIYKHRLRRKLELDKDELIDGLVDDI